MIPEQRSKNGSCTLFNVGSDDLERVGRLDSCDWIELVDVIDVGVTVCCIDERPLPLKKVQVRPRMILDITCTWTVRQCVGLEERCKSKCQRYDLSEV